MNRLLFFLISTALLQLGCYTFVYGQEFKKEQETRISESEVPKNALHIIEDFEVNRKKKWYKQDNFDHTSYEVKFKYDGHFYSLEFNNDGKILDVEKLVKWDELQEKQQEKIEQSLSKQYDYHKIIKIQIQYTGDADDLEDLFDGDPEDEDLDKLTEKLEIELEAKKEGSWKLFEVLLLGDGSIDRERVIIGRSTENLNY